MKEKKELSNTSIVVGITGGIGSGKSSVARIFAGEGFPVISTDNRAKELMISDEKIIKRLTGRFGSEIYNPDGSLNTNLLSQKVFGKTEEHSNNLQYLNSVIHPVVIEDMIETVSSYESKGERLIFVESALIYEAGLEDGFDYVIVVNTPKDLTLERLAKEGKFSEEEMLLRMNEQIPPEEKTSWADFVLDNSGNENDLKKSALFILDILKNIK